MIEITLFYQEKILVGIESRGHSGYSEKGSDIICSAVSVLMQSLIFGLSEIAKLADLEIKIDEKKPLMKISWPKEQNEKISLLTQTTAESLKIIASQNSGFIKIQTEEIK